MKISAWLIGKQSRGGKGFPLGAKEEQKKGHAQRCARARKYFLDYYQGLRSPLTAKYCSQRFFIIMPGNGALPVEHAVAGFC